MAFRSISTNAVDDVSGTIVITAPSGIQNGDILVAFACSDSTGTTITWPSGFTDITGSPITTTTDAQRLFCATKLASSESGDYTFVGSDQIVGGIAVFSGRTASATPHKSSTNNQNTGQASAWSISSAAYASNTTATCDIIVIVGSDTLNAGDVDHSAAASGLTERADLVGTNDAFINMAVYTIDGVASGASGAYTVTGTQGGSSAGWSAFSAAFSAAGGGGGAVSSGLLRHYYDSIVSEVTG